MMGLPWPPPSTARRWLENQREELTRWVGEDRLPVRGEDPFGCGAWGCVWPTKTPEIAFKLTLDAHEARFVECAKKLEGWPIGISKHFACDYIKESYYQRTVWALWRERAISMDRTHQWNDGETEHGKRFRFSLEGFCNFSLAALPSLEHSKIVLSNKPIDLPTKHEIMEASKTSFGARNLCRRHRGERRVAFALKIARMFAEEERAYGFAPTVPDALLWYLDRGIVLADVHEGNIGLIDRNGIPTPAIIDPGHVGVLNEPPWRGYPRPWTREWS